MRRYDLEADGSGGTRVRSPYRGADLLSQPMYNKGSAFTPDERRALGLDGLLPDVVAPMELQAQRVYGHIARKSDPLERYIGLAALQDRNEHLYYRVLLDHLEEFLPIVYTPTVGQASKRFSHIFRRGRGVWLTPQHRGRMAETLRNTAYAGVRLIVVTDNAAILGIGDQGAGGMVIPIGKLAIYSAAAGIHPAKTLPVSLDFGTDNEELLADELYMGWRHERLRGDAYAELVEEFVEAVCEVFPRALLQWEDFSKKNAFDLLERYRGRLVSFNDDIQGTGATALAGFVAAGRLSGRALAEERIVILGAGAAGKGIALQLKTALREAGVDAKEAALAIAALDSRGLITLGRERLDDYKRELAWPVEVARERGLAPDAGLAEVARAFRPTALIGTSGQPGSFTEEIVREISAGDSRPLIFPFSNPTDNSEARPADVLAWSEGRAMVATGSPFDPVEHDGREIRVGQGNNALVFPGVGLGALVAEASEITETMFTAAARALAGTLRDDELEHEQLFPSTGRLREVTRAVAEGVARQAASDGVGRWFRDDEALAAAVAESMWEPRYPRVVPGD